MLRRALLVIAAAALAAGCGSQQKPKITFAPQPRSAFDGGVLHPPRTAPAIALHGPDGTPMTLRQQRGRYVLVTFLYTHCPDVCPLIAENLNLALRRLGSPRVEVIAVSVDPKGDTAKAVTAYRRRMHLLPSFHYLIGSAAQLRRVWAAWHVSAVQSKPDLVDHVAYTALVDPTGKERLLYDASVRAAQVVHDLRLMMRTE
jgi:protein SCO1/2